MTPPRPPAAQARQKRSPATASHAITPRNKAPTTATGVACTAVTLSISSQFPELNVHPEGSTRPALSASQTLVITTIVNHAAQKSRTPLLSALHEATRVSMTPTA